MVPSGTIVDRVEDTFFLLKFGHRLRLADKMLVDRLRVIVVNSSRPEIGPLRGTRIPSSASRTPGARETSYTRLS